METKKAYDMANTSETIGTAMRLHRDDNVATALRDLPAGSRPAIADCHAPVLVSDVARGHKFALNAIAASHHAVKYGQEIGVAQADIAPGEHVHLHNLEGLAGRTERHRRES